MRKVVRVILRIIPYLFACAWVGVGIALQNSISDHSISEIDRVCGPIPTLESIK